MYSTAVLYGTDASFESDLKAFIGKYAGLWCGSTRDALTPDVTFEAEEQRQNERETDRQIESLERELRNYPRGERQQSAWRERIFLSLRRFGTASFRFPDRHFDIIFSPEYFAVTRTFARQAYAFDPDIETAALAQAMRNVWVMNCLQMFLGRRPSLAPSIFAYSMLYPYTDNYLDRTDLSGEAKEMANRRLEFRLAGRILEPLNANEAAIFRLVEMIEGEYPRGRFPDVYSSLLAIHAGQVKSLHQQGKFCILNDESLLQISVEKGGSSVLADGWLVGGSLHREEAEFFFGFGVMLQLLDDLQDLPDDLNAGHWTLFARAASHECLDSLTNQLWHFMNHVLDCTDCCVEPGSLELKDLIRRNCRMLLLRSVAESACYYSSGYLSHMERLSPLSFAFLRDRRIASERRFAVIWPALARRRNLRSIFDLLG
jgi:hypothetical protein